MSESNPYELIHAGTINNVTRGDALCQAEESCPRTLPCNPILEKDVVFFKTNLR